MRLSVRAMQGPGVRRGVACRRRSRPRRRLAAPQRRTHVLGQPRRHAMNTTTVRTRFVLVLALVVLAVLGATSSALACVVGTGTSASCTEAALNACLPGGGSFDGTVTFGF